MSEQTACERISRLRGVTWRWRPDVPGGLCGDDMGVIAQEVETVLPALVKRHNNGYRAVDYDGLIVELLAAITELDDRAAVIEATVAAPEARARSACELVARISPDDPAANGLRELDPARVLEMLPAIVRRDKHGHPQIAYHTLVAPLIEAVKELDARLSICEEMDRSALTRARDGLGSPEA